MHIVGLLLKNQHRGTWFLSSLCKIEHRAREILHDKTYPTKLVKPNFQLLGTLIGLFAVI